MLHSRIKAFGLKSLCLLAMLFAFAQTAQAAYTPGTKLYVDMNSSFATANAVFKVQFKSATTDGPIVDLEHIEDYSYVCTVPDGSWTKMDIRRCDPNNPSNAWNTLSNIAAPSATSGYNWFKLRDNMGCGSWSPTDGTHFDWKKYDDWEASSYVKLNGIDGTCEYSPARNKYRFLLKGLSGTQQFYLTINGTNKGAWSGHAPFDLISEGFTNSGKTYGTNNDAANFQFDADTDHWYTIFVTGDNVYITVTEAETVEPDPIDPDPVVPDPKNLFVRYNNSTGWHSTSGSTGEYDEANETYKYSFTFPASKDKEFGIKLVSDGDNTGTWWGTGDVKNNTKIESVTKGGNGFWWKGADGDVTVTFTCKGDGEPVNYEFSGPEEVIVLTPKSFGFKHENSGNWTTGDMQEGQSLTGTNPFRYTLKATLYTGEHFAIAESDGTQYGPQNDTDVQNGNTAASTVANAGRWTWKGGNGEVTITFLCNADGTPNTVNFAGPEAVVTPTKGNEFYATFVSSATGTQSSTGTWKEQEQTFAYSFILPGVKHGDKFVIRQQLPNNGGTVTFGGGEVTNGSTLANSTENTQFTWIGGDGDVTIHFNCAVDGTPAKFTFVGQDYVEATEYVVYFDTSTVNWTSAPNVHAYNVDSSNKETNSTTTGKWPGDAMTFVSGTIYKWTLPAGKLEPSYVIFNGTGGQVPGGTSKGFTAENGHVYTNEGDAGLYSEYGQVSAPKISIWKGDNKADEVEATLKPGTSDIFVCALSAPMKKYDSFQFLVDGTRYGREASSGNIDSTWCPYTCKKNASTDNTDKLWYGMDDIDSQTFNLEYNATTGDLVIVYIGERTYAIPVLPAAVAENTDAQWLNISAENPAVYLLGNVLNDNRVTPEYEMIKGEDGLYHINNIAMRNDDIHVAVFSDPYTRVDGEHQASNVYTEDSSWYVTGWEAPRTPGRSVNVTYNPATKELTVDLVPHDIVEIDGTTKELPPFIAFVGGEYVQEENYTTPSENREQKTDNGWQESWIQYKNGKVLTDLDGNVMYATRYPIQHENQIFFKQKNGDIEVNSDNLTFTPKRDTNGNVIYLTGAEWKELLNGAEEGTDYYALFNSEGKDDNDNDMTSLVDDNVYVRYTVPNAWLLGESKIWTGWNGGDVKNGDNWTANWNNHIEWGFGDDSHKASGDYLHLEPGKPYQVVTYMSNFGNDDPTYYKNVDFFYCVKAGDATTAEAAHKYSVFYTTEAYGDAKISARAKDNERGQFVVSVSDLAPTDRVKSITVRRYSATLSGTDESTWVAIDAQGKTYANDVNAKNIVHENDFTVGGDQTTLLDPLTETEFNELYKNYDSNINTGISLAPGKYFYAAEIVFDRGEGNDDVSVIVKSNPFTIVKTGVRPIVKIRQLVNPGPNISSTYYTFVPSDDDRTVPSIEGIEKVQAYATGSVSTPTAISIEEAENTVLGIYNTGIWTNRFLIRVEIPEEDKDVEVSRWVLERADGGVYRTDSYDVNPDFKTVVYAYNGIKPSFLHIEGIYDEKNEAGETIKSTVVMDTEFMLQPILPSVIADGVTFETEQLGQVNGDIRHDYGEFDINNDAEHHALKAVAKVKKPTVDVRTVTLKTNDPSDKNYGTLLNSNLNPMTITPNVTFSTGDLEATADVTADTYVTLNGIDPRMLMRRGNEMFMTATTSYSTNNAVYDCGSVWSADQILPELVAPVVDGKLYFDVKEEKEGNNNWQLNFYLKGHDVIPTEDFIGGHALCQGKDHDSFAYTVNGYKTLKTRKDIKAMGGTQNIIALTDMTQNLGTWWDGMYEDAKARAAAETYELGVSQLYLYNISNPTMTVGETPVAANVRARRAAANGITHAVIETPVANVTLRATDALTSVEGISAEGVYVAAGNGVIVIAAQQAEVYNVAGTRVATGAGEHYVPAGVYVVRADGQTVKVIVK